jgi:hypothetical protein
MQHIKAARVRKTEQLTKQPTLFGGCSWCCRFQGGFHLNAIKKICEPFQWTTTMSLADELLNDFNDLGGTGEDDTLQGPSVSALTPNENTMESGTQPLSSKKLEDIARFWASGRAEELIKAFSFIPND